MAVCCSSPSTNSTVWPASTRAIARLMARVVFPTPPLLLPTARIIRRSFHVQHVHGRIDTGRCTVNVQYRYVQCTVNVQPMPGGAGAAGPWRHVPGTPDQL